MTAQAGNPPFARIRLELEGDPGRGYELVAPLTPDGRIDAGAWRRAPASCTVRRFWRGDDDRHGHLVLTRSRRWTFRFALDNDPQDDESGWKLDALRFERGGRVAIADQDGVVRRFEIVALDVTG